MVWEKGRRAVTVRVGRIALAVVVRRVRVGMMLLVVVVVVVVVITVV